MDSTLDDDGVSYHAASVMSTMVTDPPSEWTIEKPKRSLVLSKIVEAVNRWDLDSKMKIKYRSVLSGVQMDFFVIIILMAMVIVGPSDLQIDSPIFYTIDLFRLVVVRRCPLLRAGIKGNAGFS